MAKKFIIGAGISGLIYAFYNRDFQVLSPDIGGKLKHSYLSSTILLHDTAETRRFISDLGIELKAVPHLMKYHYKGKLHENIPASLKEMMVAKKLTSWRDLNTLNFDVEVHNVPDNTLSTNDIYIPVFKVSTAQLIKLLAKHTTFMKDRVIRITADEIVTEKKRLEYDELISTIPAPVFWKLYGEPKKLQYLPETFIVSKTAPVQENKVPWDLIYFLDKETPFTRVNKHKGGQYLYEITGAMSEKEVRKHLPDLDIQYCYTDPYGLLMTDLNNIPPPKVRFVGRFATWRHSYKVQDAIRDSLARYDFLSMWNKQKEFNAHFFDYNKLTVDEQQRLAKDFILHILDETHEMLNEANWKMNAYQYKAIDRGKLREEWIDIFKYWLGIGQVWGFTIEDIFNEFWRKSAIVDERYREYINANSNLVSSRNNEGD
ncbi:MAG TPA: hypothetical protein VLF60_02915 [Candidatus Saccharimonadales bacterium]|nr:hypothetical protein [Candidatus Saccharimonadales bacterium]